MNEQRNGQANDRPAPTCREIFDHYLANYPAERSRSALKEKRRIFDLFCAFRGDPPGSPFGQRPYTELLPLNLLQFINAQKGLKATASRKRYAVAVNAPFNAAIRLGLIRHNPVAGLRMPMGARRRDWTEAEFRALLRHARPYARRLIVFVAFSGCRPGEARTMQWTDIDWDANVVVLKKHKMAWANGQVRRIRLNHVTRRLLAWMRRNLPPHRLVFRNKFGRPWSMRSLCNHIQLVRVRARISKEVRLHGGRHFFATRGLMRGLDATTMAALLGHARLETTMIYTHLVDKSEHLDRAAEQAIGRTGLLAEAPHRVNGEANLPLSKKPEEIRGAPAPVKKPKRPRRGLPPAHEAAYRAYQAGLQLNPALAGAGDAAAYAWLVEQPGMAGRLPKCWTWQRYLASARAFYNTRKHIKTFLEDLPEAEGGQP